MSTLLELTTQWTNPTEVTTVLMVIGGDVVQKALAQCTGTLYVPVCFSFGWVSFAFVALVNVLGDGRLLPPPDYPVKIFNLKSGYVRDNKNWVIGRILRDHERSMWRKYGLHSSGIRISVFDAKDPPGWEQGNRRPFSYGRLHLYGILFTVLQLLIAAIPIIVEKDGQRDWGIMVITAGGTFLALLFGAIPQWTVEKLPSRMRSKSIFALTSGNGSKDIMVIRGLGKCWDLEDFAALDSPRNGRAWDTFKFLKATPPEQPVGEDSKLSSPRDGPDIERAPGVEGNGNGNGNGTSVVAPVHTNTTSTRRDSFVTASRDFRGVPMGFAVTMAVCIAQSILWLVLLITVAALSSNTWYLVAVGGLGMFQNAYLAAMTRRADLRGLHLECVDTIITRKVMDGLMDLEVEYGYAEPLVGEFFSGKLRPDEVAWWNGDRERYDRKRMEDGNRGIARSFARGDLGMEHPKSGVLTVVPVASSESGPAAAASSRGGVEGVTVINSAGPLPGGQSSPSALEEVAQQVPTTSQNSSGTRSVSFDTRQRPESNATRRQ